jgi:hypothetical protein
VNGASGGSGASETNTLSISAGGSLTYSNEVFGGNGGQSDGGTAGPAGNATARIFGGFAIRPKYAEFDAIATGGNGGSCTSGAAAPGGNGLATAYFSTNIAQNFSISARANTNLGQGDAAGGSVTTGTGGAGGIGAAVVQAIETSPTFSEQIKAIANSLGGTGGSSGAGYGGAGGLANGEATGTTANGGDLTIQLTETGGMGGQGAGAGFSGGAGGAAYLNNPVSGSATGSATVEVTGIYQGGNGGTGINGAAGGAGSSVSVTNTVSGSAISSLSLAQEAFGGNNGQGDVTNATSAGNATSSLSTSVTGIANFTATASGTGGNAGAAAGSYAALGGSGTGTCNISSNATGTLTVNAYGNYIAGAGDAAGGAISSGSGGSGGGGQAYATGNDTGSGNVVVNAISIGGAGGQGSGGGNTGGKGGDAFSMANASSTSGQAQAIATATSGNGAAANMSSSAGSGGSATANATTHGVIANEYLPRGFAQQMGSTAFAEVTWTPSAGALVVLGPGGVNNGQSDVHGSVATINTISGIGSLTVGSGSDTTVLHVNPNSGASSQSSLVVATGATFDLNNNQFYINYGSSVDPITTIQGYLQSGYNNGAWNGPGIDSSAAAATPGYGLGYADPADPGNPAGLSSGTIEIAYTLLGDANLDGAVNGVDFGILAANFNKGVSRWDQGDFNYDNIVNGVDFGFLAANFNKGASGGSTLDDPALVAFAEANGLMADVPEPGVVGFFTVAVVGTLARRRRVI